MSKPRVLVLVDWFLPGYRGGGPIKSVANLTAALAEEFDFAIVTRDRDEGDTEQYRDVLANRWLTRKDGIRVFYASPGQRLRDVIEAERFDVMYINCVFSPRFALRPAMWALRRDLRVVIAPRGSLQKGALGLKPMRKRLLLWTARLSGLPKRATWHATDRNEAHDVVHAFGTSVNVVVAPNIPDQPSRIWQAVPKYPGRVRLVFFSRISRKKNLEYLIQCLGKALGNIELDIIGPCTDATYLRRCEQLARRLPPNVHTRFVGPLPPDALAEALQAYHFAVFPTLGENFGHTIFEALQAGKPVLVSDRTPWRGLQSLGVGWDLPLSNRSAFIRVISDAADMDQDTYDRMSTAAINYSSQWLDVSRLVDLSLKLFLW